MNWRHLLLLAYPRSWRDEYGEELAGILEHKRLAPRLLADVIANGARQQLREPWKLCGGCLLVWTCLGLALKIRLAAPSIYRWYGMAVPLTLFGTATWTAMREKCRTREAVMACWKAALLCFSADILACLLYGPTVIRGAHGSVWYQWGLYGGTSLALSRWGWVRLCSEIMLLQSALLGFLGAALSRFIVAIRQGLRPA